MYKHVLISRDSLFKLKDAICNLEKEGYEGVSMVYNEGSHTYTILMKNKVEDK